MPSDLEQQVADVIGVAVHVEAWWTATPAWNSIAREVHFAACQEIVRRLLAAGISETAILNALVFCREPSE